LESRHGYREELRAVEVKALDALDLVAGQLTRTLEALAYQDVELAGMVIAANRDVDRRYVELHDAVLSVIARHAPVASDLRFVSGVLTVSRCIERIGDQCVSIAKLVPMSGYETPRDKEMLDMIERMGELAHAQITEVHQALKTRDASLARDIARQDEEINRLNRDVFQRSLAISDDPEIREWAMFMILAARCLERIGDNTVEIAEQVVRSCSSSPASTATPPPPQASPPSSPPLVCKVPLRDLPRSPPPHLTRDRLRLDGSARRVSRSRWHRTRSSDFAPEPLQRHTRDAYRRAALVANGRSTLTDTVWSCSGKSAGPVLAGRNACSGCRGRRVSVWVDFGVS
jgi:phosphate transport system protein